VIIWIPDFQKLTVDKKKHKLNREYDMQTIYTARKTRAKHIKQYTVKRTCEANQCKPLALHNHITVFVDSIGSCVCC